MAADERFHLKMECPIVFSAGILELVALALIAAPISLLIGVILLLVIRRKKK